MRRIVLTLNDEKFIELYAMTKSFVRNNDNSNALADLMGDIHDQCELWASESEREHVNEAVENVAQVLQTDSPDLYLAKAGMSGLMDQIIDKL